MSSWSGTYITYIDLHPISVSTNHINHSAMEFALVGHVLVSSQQIPWFVGASDQHRASLQPRSTDGPMDGRFLQGAEDEAEFSELGNGMRLIMAPRPRRSSEAMGWSRGVKRMAT